MRHFHPRVPNLGALGACWVLPALLLWTACSGSGGSSGGAGFDRAGPLLAVTFPDPSNINSEDESTPPQAASLVQQIVFEFGGRPNPDSVDSGSIQVRTADGSPVAGRYLVDDHRVTFVPRLPLRPASSSDDNGGAGLQPGSLYTVRVGKQVFDFVDWVDADLKARFPDHADPDGILLAFQTTTVKSEFFKGLERAQPRLTAVHPVDGATNVSPNLYSDPAGLFDERGPFRLEFDRPLHPADTNLGKFLLVDLDDASAGPGGLPLGIDATLLENEIDRAVVEVMPSGILPFDHLLSLEVPILLRHLSSQSTDAGDETQIAATFTTSSAPTLVSDALVEEFDDNAREETSPAEFALGTIPARWNERSSGVLEAAFAFEGAGELGRFIPDPPDDGERTILFDTTRMVFPLFDGSTPDVPPGTEVIGGVFSFTDIDIPKGIVIEVRGPNPLVFTATGSVRIGGKIQLNGQAGVEENAFDSAVTSLPGGSGGAGGGRGGVGQPIVYFPADDVSNLTLVTPFAGGTGWGPGNVEQIGGTGGQTGMLDHKPYGVDNEIVCTEVQSSHNNGYKPPGGGGGTFLKKGKRPDKDGIGNVLPDGQGGWILRTKKDDGDNFDVLIRGDLGQLVFVDEDKSNDFFGVRGEHQQIHGGQGGGAGGSAADAYYCGVWCLRDLDPNNDDLCLHEWGDPPSFADSVGDARGGSGGGGGGALQIKALGPITLSGSAVLSANGGKGGGGEALGCGNWAGSGGGGSGGFIGLQSADSITVFSGATVETVRGLLGEASSSTAYLGCDEGKKNIGAGGDGGHGLIQLQVPAGTKVNAHNGHNIFMNSWSDPDNLLNPAEFTPVSVAVSTWFDMGRTVTRSPGSTPEFSFFGLDASGFVETDADGNVLDSRSIRCDYLGQEDPLDPGQYKDGQEPRANYIPPNATVQVEFQGADAVVAGSKEVDPATITPWTAEITDLDGMQFLRYRITFDITADSSELGPESPRPAVQTVQIESEF